MTTVFRPPLFPAGGPQTTGLGAAHASAVSYGAGADASVAVRASDGDYYMPPGETGQRLSLPAGTHTQAGILRILQRAKAMQDQAAFRVAMAEVDNLSPALPDGDTGLNAAHATQLLVEMARATGVSLDFVQAAVRQSVVSQASVAEQMKRLGAQPARYAVVSTLYPVARDIAGRLIACFIDAERDPMLFEDDSSLGDPIENKQGNHVFRPDLAAQGFDYAYGGGLNVIKGTKVAVPFWKFWVKETHVYRWGYDGWADRSYRARLNLGYLLLYCQSSDPSKVYLHLTIKDPKFLMRIGNVVEDLRAQGVTVEIITHFTPADFR